MLKVNLLDNLQNAERAVTFGKFDGIHLGHQKLINKITKKDSQGLKSTVFTFDRAPASLFDANSENTQLNVSASTLLTNSERERIFTNFGIDTLFEYKVSRENMSVPADEFVINVIKNRLNAKYIAVGEDFHFGKNRQGDVMLLEKMADECGYELEVVEKEKLNGEVISSSLIKEQLKLGNIENVNKMLGYTYSVTGKIIKGNQLGRTWNIPTINVTWPNGKIQVCFGVYYSHVQIEDKLYYGMTNIGCKPSIEGKYQPGAETYLYNCNENLYGKTANIQLLHFRRREEKFSSIEILIQQLKKDIRAGEELFMLTNVK